MTSLPKKFRSNARWFRFVPCFFPGIPVAAIFGALVGPTLAVVCGLLPVVYAFLVVAKVGVEATSQGLVLHDYSLRVRRIRWGEIDHIELAEAWPWNGVVVAVSGRRYKTLGLGASHIGHEASMANSRRKVDELNLIRSEVLASREDI